MFSEGSHFSGTDMGFLDSEDSQRRIKNILSEGKCKPSPKIRVPGWEHLNQKLTIQMVRQTDSNK